MIAWATQPATASATVAAAGQDIESVLENVDEDDDTRDADLLPAAAIASEAVIKSQEDLLDSDDNGGDDDYRDNDEDTDE